MPRGATALLPVLSILLACGAGTPSKEQAKRILDEWYAGKTAVYGNIAVPIGHVALAARASDFGRDADALFGERVGSSAAKIQGAVRAGVLDVKFDRGEWQMIAYHRQLYVHYNVEPTDEGKKYLREPVQNWNMAFFRIADRQIAEVTGVFPEGENGAKVYFRIATVNRTPFFDLVGEIYQQSGPAEMTAYLVNDGKAWRVQDVQSGTL